MKERAMDRERAVVAHDQLSEVSKPSIGALHDPSPAIAPQGPTVLGRGPNAISLVRADQFDSPLLQTFPQRLLSRTARVMTACYADRRQRGPREFDFRRGCSSEPRGGP